MSAPQVCALLVLGPAHGAQILLPDPPPDVYLVPAQSDLTNLLAVRDHPLVSEMTLPVHQYRRLNPLRMRGHDGYWVYEHDGATRR